MGWAAFVSGAAGILERDHATAVTGPGKLDWSVTSHRWSHRIQGPTAPERRNAAKGDSRLGSRLEKNASMWGSTGSSNAI